MNKQREMYGIKVFVSNEAYNEYKGTLQEQLEEKDKEIDRLNNIINEFEEELEREANIKEEDVSLEHNTFIDINSTLKKVLKRFRKLKGE